MFPLAPQGPSTHETLPTRNAGEDALHRHGGLSDSRADPMETLPLVAKGSHPGDNGLLLVIRHETLRLALADYIEAKRPLATAVDATSGEVALHVSNAHANAFALVLGQPCGTPHIELIR